MGVSRKGPPMSTRETSPSPCDRILAHRRQIFLRDWLLVLIALGLAIAAGAFHSDHSKSPKAPVATSAASLPAD
jgi:hypothetical protein